MALVSGLSANLVDPVGRVGIMTQQMAAAKDDSTADRYFIIVTTYDFRACIDSNGKDRRMYWQARMSVP